MLRLYMQIDKHAVMNYIHSVHMVFSNRFSNNDYEIFSPYIPTVIILLFTDQVTVDWYKVE